MKSYIQIATSYCKDKEFKIIWHFIEAKYDHSQKGKMWYSKEFEVSDIGIIKLDHSIVDNTLDELDTVISNLKIDVLLGFSEGSNLVDTHILNKSNSIKCCVIFSGYSFVDTNRKQIDIPMMNVCSDIDEIVKIQFMPIYKNMIVKKHNMGHKIPMSKPFIREIIEFVYLFCKNKNI